MNQLEGQRSNQQLNQYQNQKQTLQRSVSPICKLIILNNLNSSTNVQKSMRAKNDTLILDVILYLEKQYQNQCTIKLYHNKNPIDVDKNTYLLPFLQKLQIQQLDYKTENKLQSQIGIDDDESPRLVQKLAGKDSSPWGPKLQERHKYTYVEKNKHVEEDKQKVNNEFNQSSISPITQQQQYSQSAYSKMNDNNSSTQSQVDNEEQEKIGKTVNYYNSNLNNSEITIQSIRCQCGHSYNSQQLRNILKNAILQNQIAKCQKCNQPIPKSMYKQIKIFEKEYHQLKLSLDLEILKNTLIPKFDISKCQFCNFFWIFDKNKKFNSVFCPNCIQNGKISKKN